LQQQTFGQCTKKVLLMLLLVAAATFACLRKKQH
jgi:hypothetical protein